MNFRKKNLRSVKSPLRSTGEASCPKNLPGYERHDERNICRAVYTIDGLMTADISMTDDISYDELLDQR